LKHVEDSNKHVIEETVRQVGYLPEFFMTSCHVTCDLQITFFIHESYENPIISVII